MKTEIVSIKLKFGKKEVELTKEEAADLHKQLSELFKSPVSYVYPYWTYTTVPAIAAIQTPSVYCSSGTVSTIGGVVTSSTGNLGVATTSNRCEALSFTS